MYLSLSLDVFEMRPSQLLRFRLTSAVVRARKKEKAIPAFTRPASFVKYLRSGLLYGSPPTEHEVNYAGT